MKLIYVDDSVFDQMAFKRLMKNFNDIQFEVYSSFNEIDEDQLILKESILIRDCYLGDSSSIEFEGTVYFLSGGKLTDKLKKSLMITKEYFFQKPLNELNIKRIISSSDVYKFDDEPDLTYLKELSEGDEAFEKEMREIFISEVPIQLSDTLSFFNEKEYSRFSETIHALRTKLRTFGLVQLDEIADYLENESRKEGLLPDRMFIEKLNEFKNRLSISVSMMEEIQ